MPKKGKKGGKSKGKKGKGGKKGKKGGKDVKKKREENVLKLATTNSTIWESRIEMLEKSRGEYRETALKLANQNAEIHENLVKSEKDTIEVINYLKKQQTQKDEEISRLTEELLDIKTAHKKEKETIITDMSEQIAKLDTEIRQKDNDIQLLKNELKMVNEFRKKRNQLNNEFIELKEALHQSNRDHQDVIGKMEKKFFEEKMRIQLEASKKISELAERAHLEAINNLDEATRSVFKENVRANEALKCHIKNTEKQREKVKVLKAANKELESDREMLNTMVTEKVLENKKLKAQTKELNSKVELLEQALTQSVKEFDTSNERLRMMHENEVDSSKKEMEKLQRLLELRTKELKKIRVLAKQVLNDRSEIERFFLESLEMVKEEITSNQIQYKKDAQMAYHSKMKMAYQGQGDFPPVRTFNKSNTSTNSVYKDLEAAVKFIDTSGKVDISDLTWEQRERVIRYLFTKINQSQSQSKPKETNESQTLMICDDSILPPLPGAINSISSEDIRERLDEFVTQDEDDGNTFLTQGINSF